MPNKWERREQKQKAKKNQMPKHGRSLFVIEEVTKKKAEIAKKKRKKKNGDSKDSQS